jgi:hypothetical protein
LGNKEKPEEKQRNKENKETEIRNCKVLLKKWYW